jgi:3-hydroxyacyl-CoA dehydrogenase/enoyl-CoA hydratase/3-hydroxybutyryl-CoA epimerase
MPASDLPETAIRWSVDANRIVTLTLDDPHQKVNTMNALFARSFADTIQRIYDERRDLAGVILQSAKRTFFAGGDLRLLLTVETAQREEFLAGLTARKARMRRLEQAGIPIVAVMEGAALGGGLELALACHRRIAVEQSAMILGLPEVNLGLLPGGGGVVRTTRLLGVEGAVNLLLSGRSLDARTALDVGLIDELHSDPTAAYEAARSWILSGPPPGQRWEHIPPQISEEMDVLAAARSALRHPGVLSPSCPDLAPRTIAALVPEVATADVDVALTLESAAFVDVLCSPSAKAIISVMFFDTQQLRSADRRPAELSRSRWRPAVFTAGPLGRALVEQLTGLGSAGIVDASGMSAADATDAVAAAIARGEGIVWAGSLDGVGLPQLPANLDGTPVCTLIADAESLPSDVPPDVVSVWVSVGDTVVAELSRATGGPAERRDVGAGDFLGSLGVTVIELEPGRGPFGARLRRRLVAQIGFLTSEGVEPAVIAAAANTCGLALPADMRPAGTAPPQADLSGVRDRLIGAVADEALGCASEGVLRWSADLDVASVRSGGLPPWTGGASRWTKSHAQQACSQIETDKMSEDRR